MRKIISLVLCWVSLIQGQFVPPEALVEPLKPAGIRISIPHEPGITLVAYHVKFNDEFYGLEAGTIARDILKPKNGRWVYQDKTTRLKENDVVYYWVHVVYEGLGYNLVDQEYRVSCFYDLSGNKVEGTCDSGSSSSSSSDCLPSVTKVYDSAGTSRNACLGELIFEENFKDMEQLEKKWTVEERFPNAPDYEFNIYKNSQVNVKVDNGLKITPKLLNETHGEDFVRQGDLTLTKCTGRPNTYECHQKAGGWGVLPPVSSGRINTKKSLNFEYGRVEIRAKFPKGDWIYPLMLLEASGFFGKVPSVQVRIAAASGNPELKTFDGSDISGRVLWGGMTRADSPQFRNRATKYSSELWSNDYHVYELSWSPSGITIKVDGQVFSDKNLNLSGTPVYLTLGVAVGGLLEFPDYCISHDYAKTWRNIEAKALYNFFRTTDTWYKTWKNDDTSLKVEYVKVWAL